jgi:hypothetical protein
MFAASLTRPEVFAVGRRILLLWLFTFVPFATLPWFTIAQPQPQPWYSSHLFFHIAYMPLTVMVIALAVRVAREAERRVLGVLAWIVAASSAIALVGHAAELAATVRDGGLASGEAIWDDTFHVWAANITLPGLAVSYASIVALTIVWAVGRRRSLEPIA